MDQRNRVESPEIHLFNYSQVIFDKVTKNTQWIKNSLFNEWCQKTGQPYAEEQNWINLGQSFINFELKWIEYLNIRSKAIKPLGRKHRGKSFLTFVWVKILGYNTKSTGNKGIVSN